MLLAIMILVFVHEMGHFLFAKLFGMRVDRFSVGFPPNVLSKKMGETEYVLGVTPLGGYVKIAGMVDESMDTEFVASEPESWEFRSKPVWQRIVVITAGVVFNILLAAVVFSTLKYAGGETFIPAENVKSVFIEEGTFLHDLGLRTGDRVVAVNGKEMERADEFIGLNALIADRLTITVERNGESVVLEGPEDVMTQLNRSQGNLGISYSPSIVGGVAPESPAAALGLETGDRIVLVDSEPVEFWNQLTSLIRDSGGAPLVVRWQRHVPNVDEQSLPADVTVVDRDGDLVWLEGPIVARELTFDGEEYFGIGIRAPSAEQMESELGFEVKNYGLVEAVGAGIDETWITTKAIVTSLSRVVTGRDNFRETMGGPVAIARETKRAAEGGYFWRIVAMLSITLAIVNILPIPALDGGHLMFLLYEGITRREPSVRLRMITQQIGMIVLLAFMAFLIYNDILRL